MKYQTRHGLFISLWACGLSAKLQYLILLTRRTQLSWPSNWFLPHIKTKHSNNFLFFCAPKKTEKCGCSPVLQERVNQRLLLILSSRCSRRSCLLNFWRPPDARQRCSPIMRVSLPVLSTDTFIFLVANGVRKGLPWPKTYTSIPCFLSTNPRCSPRVHPTKPTMYSKIYSIMFTAAKTVTLFLSATPGSFRQLAKTTVLHSTLKS